MDDVPEMIELEQEPRNLSIQIDFCASDHHLSQAQTPQPGLVPEESKPSMTCYTLYDLHQLAPNSNILEKQSGSELAGAIFDIFPGFKCDIEATKHHLINEYPANFWLSCLFLIDLEKKKMMRIETDKLTVFSACFQAYNEQPHMNKSLDIETYEFFQLCPTLLAYIKHVSQQYLKKEEISGGFLLLQSSFIM